MTNVHKPCLAQHAAFIVEQNGGDASWLSGHFDKLLRYVDYYMQHCRHENGLYYWIDDCAIGVDKTKGSIEVGKASTNAVVHSSILILFSDLILTHLLSK